MTKITVQVTDPSIGIRELVADARVEQFHRPTTDPTGFVTSHVVTPLTFVGAWESDNRVQMRIGSGKYRVHDPPLPDQSFIHARVPGGEVCVTCEDIEIRDLFSYGGRGRHFALGWFQDVANCRCCNICRLFSDALKEDFITRPGSIPSSTEVSGCFVILDVIETVTPLPPLRRDRPFELRGLLIDPKTRLLRAIAHVRPSLTSASLLKKSTLFSARPVNTNAANLDLARAWIDECCNSHTEIEDLPHQDQLHDATVSRGRLSKSVKDILARNRDRRNSERLLRLVDVNEGNLSLQPRTQKYIALSYVWPRFESLRLLKSNSEILHGRGALLRLQNELSRVIRDAIEVTRKLGQRYLWVDALCITQDDETEKQKLINSMDYVYGDAVCTLVVATETEPIHDYGIPGINGTPRTARQHAGEVEGVQLLAALADLHSSVKRSVWSTRGWTFQEQLLSQRCLIFSDQQMFFRCPHDYRAEDVQAEGSKELIRHPAKPVPQEEQVQYLTGSAFFKSLRKDNTFHEYSQIVRAYTPRKLTNSNDILHAFKGIVMAMLAHLPYPQGFFVALPIHAFDRALLWYPTSKLERRATIVTAGQTLTELPTWSWVGWMGSVQYEKRRDLLGDFDSQRAIVLWWRWEDGSLIPIKDHSRYLTRELEFSWCMLAARARGMKPAQLIFWGTCVELSVSEIESYITGWVSDAQQALPCFALLDRDGDRCGMLPSADREWAERHLKSGVSSDYQFLLLAHVQQSELDEDSERSKWLDPKFKVELPSRDQSVSVCFYSVMLLEFDEEGIAYRRGVGRVHQDAVNRHMDNFSRKIIILS